ncbi:response regulator transcription factor [Streptosporangium sp. NPDC087985]|uniref:response regulator transcription factor n=1 Tax=Streptosporangium sp. NPDC087985 TaxID=3366196 RepID=UPI00381F3108
MRLLVVEDDDGVAAALSSVLRMHGFGVVRAATGRAGLEALERQPIDLVLLDLGLPDRDGLEVCGRMRRAYDVPIIVVTARTELNARVHGLSIGADDYMVKPYDLRELMARIHAVTRRTRGVGTDGQPGRGRTQVVMVQGVRIDRGSRQVTVHNAPVSLTRKEFDVLDLLASAPGVVVRRERILAEVWQTSWEGAGRTLEVHVASLRAKLGVPAVIETVRGVGYRLAMSVI